MGAFDWLFGGKPQYQAPPGLGDFQNYLKDWLGTGPSGPEFAWGRGVMRQLRKGTFNPENDEMFKAYSDPVTAGYGVSLREGLRENEMNSALLPGQQGIISQALNNQLTQKMGDEKGMAMRGVLKDYLDRAQGAYDTGQNRYLQMAGIALPQLGQTYRDYQLAGRPGILGQLSQLSKLIAGFASGDPSAAGGGANDAPAAGPWGGGADWNP
jgi:hypothetical protein